MDLSECEMLIVDLATRGKCGKGENDNDKSYLMKNENMTRREMNRWNVKL